MALSILKCLKNVISRFNEIGNWITKEYDKDGWHIIEYHNGWCRLYYEHLITVHDSGWTAWGSVYYKVIPEISYPVTFSSVPFQFIELKTTSGSGWFANIYNTKSNTGKQQINRPTSGTEFSAKITYSVYGKLGGYNKSWRYAPC